MLSTFSFIKRYGRREGVSHWMSDQTKKYFILDVSGQKVTEFDAEEYHIVHKNSAHAFKEIKEREEERLLDQRGEYVQFIIEPNQALSELTIQQRRYLVELMPYVGFQDQPLGYIDEEGTVIYLNNQMIQEIWGVTRIVALELLNLFTEKQFFNKQKDPLDKRKTNYIPTGLYFGKGKLAGQAHKLTTKIFQSKLKEVIENVRKIEDRKNRRKKSNWKQSAALGMIHAVLPYFHYQTYYLVKNPNENILQKGETVNDALSNRPYCMKHLKKTELARISNVAKTDTIDKYIDILVEAGAIKKETSYGKSVYIVHPDLMFRRDGNGLDEYSITIRNQFEQLRRGPRQ